MTQWERKERQILGLLQQQYEDRGYTFVMQPPSSMLPHELANLKPDAIALRDNEREVVEIKLGAPSKQVSELRDAVSRVPGWTLRVVTAPIKFRHEPVSLTNAERINSALSEFEGARRSGFRISAFLLGWSIFELVLFRVLSDGYGYDPEVYRGPIELISSAEIYGEIPTETAFEMKSLFQKRNKLAHGGLADEPSEADLIALAGWINSFLARVGEFAG